MNRRQHRRLHSWRRDADDGVFTLELVLWAVPLALILMIVVAGGRIVAARSTASAAANEAARAASLYRGPGNAEDAARAAAEQALSAGGVTCHDLRVTVSGDTRPGGSITVDVACVAHLRDLALPGAPGSQTLHGTSTVPIEKTRSST